MTNKFKKPLSSVGKCKVMVHDGQQPVKSVALLHLGQLCIEKASAMSGQ